MGKQMSYQTALDYILSFADYERIPRSGLVWDLRRMEMLLERLGNPQEAARSIHIAGTKGKGSTAAMIASILTRAGYKVGLYTSPYILSPTECIKINNRDISKEKFSELAVLIKEKLNFTPLETKKVCRPGVRSTVLFAEYILMVYLS